MRGRAMERERERERDREQEMRGRAMERALQTLHKQWRRRVNKLERKESRERWREGRR